MSALVDGELVNVGDWVGFKQDVEQSGEIIKIRKDVMGRKELVLQNTQGFDGGYIGGETTTWAAAEDCWLI